MITVDQILLDETHSFIQHSNYSQAKFVHDLLLPALVESGLEQPVAHKTADEYEAWRSGKVRNINNILNQKTNFPLKWLWVWLAVLPAPYGPNARKHILALGGAADVSPGLSLCGPSNSDLPGLLREAADVLAAGAVVAADGKYDSNDSPEELHTLSNEITDVIEAALAELAKIDQAVSLDGRRGGVVLKLINR